MTTRPLPPSSPPQIHHHHHPQLLLLFLVPLSSILLLLLLLIYLYHHYHHRQATTTVATTTSSIPHVPFHLLSSSFHPSLALGRGASSSVFLATLPDNPTTPVAVKLFHSHQRHSFLHELHLHSLLPRPSSPFVVPLLAHSSSTASHAHGHRHLLVFEYLPNRSLQDALFDPEHLVLLPWPLRLSILLDVAEALSYLHHNGIVHGDVKPSNILLSSDFRAKLSDFGLARVTTPNTHHVKEPIGTQICPLDDDTHHEEAKKMPEKKKKKKRKRKMREWWKEEPTPEQRKKQGRRLRENNVDVPEKEEEVMPRGTVCYVAPEWSSPSMWGEKADVYSFGVLTLVVLSGRRPLHVVASPMKLEKANLVGWCRQLLATGGDLLEVVDERLHRADYDEVEVRTCLGLAVLCLQRVPYLRPRSSDVVKILKGEAPLPPLPPSLSPSPRRRRRSLPEVAESN